MPRTSANLDELILGAYQAVADPGSYRNYLARLGAELGGHIVALHDEALRHQSDQVVMTVGLDESEYLDLQARYSEFAHENLWMQRAATRLMRDGVVDSADVCDHREMAQTNYFIRVLRPIDIDHSLGILLSSDPQHQAVLTINRAGVDRPFTSAHHDLVRRLRPHLVQAFRMMRQRPPVQSDLPLLDATTDCVFIVSDDLDVLWQNNTSKAIESERAPFRIRSRRLVFGSAADLQCAAELTRAAAVHGHSVQRRLLATTDRGPRWVLSVLPCPAAMLPVAVSNRRCAILVLRSDRFAGHDGQQRLVQMLHLSSAEAALALAMRSTRDLGLAAVQVGVSWHTARSQIKSIMQKTQTHKQTELLRLIDLCVDAL